MKEKTRIRIDETGVELTSSLEREERADLDSDSRFRILVLGDFSGREGRSTREADDSGSGFKGSPIRVDRDNLDELPGKLGVEARIQLVPGGAFLDAPIRRLEDFHPDFLFRQLAGFRYLKQTRLDLQDPEAFDRGAREVRSWESLAPLPEPDADTAGGSTAAVERPETPATDTQDLVREMLERSEERAAAAESGRTDFDRFVEGVVKSHLVPADPPDRDDLIRRADDTIGSWMRSILHHPRFQGLEAAWRGLAFLVERLDSSNGVEIHILDVSRDELAEDLRSSGGVAESRIAGLLVGPATGGDGRGPWSLLAGMYTFGPDVEDIAMLGRLGKVASAAGAPFLAAASPELIGRPSFGESSTAAAPGEESPEKALWAALRDLPEAAWIALALPRFLLRLPYGTATDPLEEFPFEENAAGFEHEDLLWGNPALACAWLIAQARASGDEPGDTRDIEDLPFYVSTSPDHEEGKATPCAESILSDREARAIMDEGLIPLISMPGRDIVRVARFQSIASPSRPIAGL
jgi:type VI secretion system protein ImpC